MYFPKQEYENRLKRCQDEMRNAGIDVLFLISEKNIFYLSGYRTSLLRDSDFRMFPMVVFQTGEPVLTIPNLEIGQAERMSWLKDVRFWGPNGYAEDSVDVLPKLLKEKGIKDCTIATELDNGMRLYMTQTEYETITDLLPTCKFVDASALMWKLRMIKSPAEQENMREAARIAETAYDDLVKNIRVGMTEKQIHKQIELTMTKEGCEVDNFVVVKAGEKRYSSMNPWPTDYAIKDGDLVMVNCGASYNGYWSNFTRVFAVGSVTKHQKVLYESVKKMRDIAIESIVAGNLLSDIENNVKKYVKEVGFEKYMLQDVGNAIGMQIQELPFVSADNDVRIKPGMCLTIAPALYDVADDGTSGGVFKISDTVLVTETGVEVFASNLEKIAII